MAGRRAGDLELNVFGPTIVRSNGRLIELRPREREVLAVLASCRPRSMAIDLMIETLWPPPSPKSARTAVHNHVARLRKSLGDHVIVTDRDGYRLGSVWSVDLDRFDDHVRRAGLAAQVGDHVVAMSHFDQAHRLVRGEAYADVADSEAIVARRANRQQLWWTVEEDRLLVMMASGAKTSAAEATRIAEQQPFREIRWMLLALALYRDDQRRESLQTFARAREHLAELAGLEPGPALVHLESMILADDPALRTESPHLLVGRLEARARSDTGAGDRFIGRVELLERVRQVMATTAVARRASVIALVGPPGIGKSAVAHRVGAHASLAGWTVATCVCSPTASRVLEPLGELVRRVVDQSDHGEDLVDDAVMSDLHVLWGDSAGVQRGDLAVALQETIEAHASRRPVLLVVDDAHHLGPSMIRRFGELAGSKVPLTILTVTPSAPIVDVEQGLIPHAVFDVGPLSDEESTLLVEATLDRELASDARHGLVTEARGNPRALLNMVAAIRFTPEGSAQQDGRPRAASSPLVGRSPELHELAELIAIVGSPCSRQMLADELGRGLGDIEPWIREGVLARFLLVLPDGRVEIAGSTIRTALVDAAPPDVVAATRERVGAILLEQGDVLAAADLLLAVAGRDPSLAIEAAGRAARAAGRASMFLEAAAYADRAAELSEREAGDESARRAMQLRLLAAQNVRLSGDPRCVVKVRDVVRTANRCGDDDIFAFAVAELCKLGPTSAAGTLDETVADLIEQAVARDGISPEALAAVAGQATLFYSMSGAIDRCRDLFDVALATARTVGDVAGLIEALGNAYISLNHPDDWPERRELASELLMLAERIDDDDARFEALHCLFAVQVQFADPLLRTTFRRQHALANSLRSAGRRWMAGYQESCLAHLDGRLDDALDLATNNLASAPVDRSRAIANYLMSLLVVRLAQSREQELVEAVDQIVVDQPALPGWRAVAAWLAALRGDHARVLAECDALDCGTGLPRDMAWSGAAMLLGRAVATTGDRERSRAVLDLLAPYTGMMTWIGSCTVGPFDLAIAELAAETGQTQLASDHIGRARHCVERINAVVYLPEIEAVEARLRERSGPEGARGPRAPGTAERTRRPSCQDVPMETARMSDPKAATDATRSANEAVLGQLPFADRQDFDDAAQGLVAPLHDGGVIRNDHGDVVWDLTRFAFLSDGSDAPATVNPSLWRQSQLVVQGGLYKVVDRLYQVRSADLSNLTIVEGDTGLIVFDPLISVETAHAAMELYFEHRPRRSVVAVVHSHSHVDHYGGVRGVVSEEDVKSGKTMIIAPAGFLEAAVAENVFAGNTMSRRASYMYGNLLEPGPTGQVGAGLGITTSSGTVTLIPPTHEITETGQRMHIDGLDFEFQLAPDTEAPSEMHWYIEQLAAVCAAENCCHTLHNTYTLRGAQIRDPQAWSKYLNELIDRWGDRVQVMYGMHHWPVWGNERVLEMLTKARDGYRYINDQTLRLANHGYTPVEIAEQVEFPPELASHWAMRPYYGSVNHNVKATYVKYLGWFDGNPANLHVHPPEYAARKYVEMMGGADKVVEAARASFADGDYRWVAEVVKHVVFADPDHTAGKELLADAFEQLGYQAETGPWRNFYLTGAKELRDGVLVLPTPNTASPDSVRAMTLDTFLDYLGIRLNGPKAAGKRLAINVTLSDTGDRAVMYLANGSLSHSIDRHDADADAALTMARRTLDDIILQAVNLPDAIAAGDVEVDGDAAAVHELLTLLDTFEFWFNIVTP